MMSHVNEKQDNSSSGVSNKEETKEVNKVHLSKSMEQSVFIKYEPAWLLDAEEEPSNFENFELASGIIPLKQETKSELTESGLTQENSFESSVDVKNEVLIEEHIVDQMQEENNVENGRAFYSCKSCSKSFKTRTILKRHLLTHTGERPHRCSECSTTFVQRGHLKTHMFTHSGEKPFSCAICSSAFTVKNNLKTHMLIHSGERSYHCTICNRTFSLKSNLNTHMLIHSGSRPYNCTICSSTFSVKNSLKDHMLTHSGERPFKCSVCGNRFSRSLSLKRHGNVHLKRSSCL